MGGGHWTDDAYKVLRSSRIATSGVAAFTHDTDIKTGKVSAKTHDRLNPYGVNRESRDSKEHPTSNAIMVIFDHTGSMGDIPKELQKKLPKLMGVLNAKAVIEHPQILFGAVGDCLSDVAPLQVGQFESSTEMDEDIDKIYLEGNGGGHGIESYDLPLYFAARHTSIDCLEKRNKKGYLFIIGDEMARNLSISAAKSIFNDNLEAPISFDQIVKEAQEKYEVFFIIPNGRGGSLKTFWQKYFGQNVLMLDDPNLVCELIANTIGIVEGSIEDVKDMSTDLGLSKKDETALTTSLSAVKSKYGGALRVKGENLNALANTGGSKIQEL